MSTPTVSVVMSVYNGQAFLREAIDSILAQTFADFELIIVNDGSSDGTADILASYADPRIRIIAHENKGLQISLNIGIRAAQGELIARMDDDDIAYPTRFQKQVDLLRAHPEIGAVGSRCVFMDQVSKKEWTEPLALTHEAIVKQFLKGSPMIHSTVMMRKALVDQVGGYDERLSFTEDYVLWVNLAKRAKLANIEEPLLIHREHNRSLTKVQQVNLPASFRLMWLGIRNRFWAYRSFDYAWHELPLVLSPMLYTFVELNPRAASKLKQIFRIKPRKKLFDA